MIAGYRPESGQPALQQGASRPVVLAVTDKDGNPVDLDAAQLVEAFITDAEGEQIYARYSKPKTDGNLEFRIGCAPYYVEFDVPAELSKAMPLGHKKLVIRAVYPPALFPEGTTKLYELPLFTVVHGPTLN